MSQAYTLLRDPPSERRASGTGGFPSDARKVKAWLDALPRANQQATLRELAGAFEAMAETAMDGVARLGVLELLRPVLIETLAPLEAQLQGVTLPLPPAKARVAEQVLGWQRTLAQSYRAAVVDACAPAGAVPFMRGGQVLQAVTRALYHGARHLAETYRLYRMPEPGAWMHMHALHRFAEDKALASKTADEPLERMPLSPTQIYVQALLLALSNPYRFSQREQAEAWTMTRDLAAVATLDASHRNADAVAVPIDDDRGPGYLPEERLADTQAHRWLDLMPLRTLLDAALEHAGEGTATVRPTRNRTLHVPAGLLRRLRQGWGQSIDRGHQRLDAGHMLDSVIGLNALHYRLAGRLDFDTFMRDVRGIGAVGDERAAWVQGSTEAARAPAAVARVLDQSLGGYRLMWEQSGRMRIRIGEIVGLAPSANEQPGGAPDMRTWMVGAVRWLRHAPDGSIDAGVELLARRAYAVGVRSLRDGIPQSPLLGIQIEVLRDGDEGLLYLLTSEALEPGVRIEVARAADPDAFEDVQPQVSHYEDLRVLEQAGDYVLLAARLDVDA